MKTLHRGHGTAPRVACAKAWLAGRSPGEEVLVVSAQREAAAELLRDAARERGGAFGWHRHSFHGLAHHVLQGELAATETVPIGRLGAEALVHRVLRHLVAARALGRFEPVHELPGLARALTRTLHDLRSAGVPHAELAERDPDLARVAARYEHELEEHRLVDRPAMLERAAALVERDDPAAADLRRPLLLLDPRIETAGERNFARALAGHAREVHAIAPTWDEGTLAALEEVLGVEARDLEESGDGSLARLQRALFGEPSHPVRPLDASVTIVSAPGENRECLEIARRIHALARDGVPFDRIAVLLHEPENYRANLEEAFERARIPVWFARGTRRPDPAGRAFLALLRCAAEDLSARRFAEYLSLGEVPQPTAEGGPPQAQPPHARFAPPLPEEDFDDDAARIAAEQERAEHDAVSTEEPVQLGRLRAPRRWERLLAEASVIGGRDRWERRLHALREATEIAERELDDEQGPDAARLARQREDLDALIEFALPLVADLEALPPSATWSTWLDALGALATRSLRRPERVLAVLGQLAPMGPIPDVAIGDVLPVLADQLLELRLPPLGARYGKVFVAPIGVARGIAFDHVFAPGLAEKMFPRKIAEDPILLDRARKAFDGPLETNEERLARERRALHAAASSACASLVLSFPRLDQELSRPRVLSFYVLEALRAAEGRLPLARDLAARVEAVSARRAAWPAPEDRERAVDEAEYDLASLQAMLDAGLEGATGVGRYLLEANPHLARALRFRHRRWKREWTSADGFLLPADPAKHDALERRAAEGLARHRLDARSYSATALQHYATCPYRFFLHAVWKLAPREDMEAPDEIDPLQRGSLVHDVLFRLHAALAEEQALPVRPANLTTARERLDAVLDTVAAEYEDRLAPAIPRIWNTGVESVRADLREFLRRASEDASGYVPWRFELAFGLQGRSGRDEHSRREPVPLACGITLRGSIDLVERRADGGVRVTDYKTGRVRVDEGALVSGGTSLQPLLYALAAEAMLGETVHSGRLYYCTAAGGFEEREVPLEAFARDTATRVATAIAQAVEGHHLPAAPAPNACAFCDYRIVCGPDEERRVRHKQRSGVKALEELRKLP